PPAFLLPATSTGQNDGNLPAQRLFHALDSCGCLRDVRHVLRHSSVGVLKPIAGQYRDGPASADTPGAAKLEQPGDTRRARRLSKEPFSCGKEAVGFEDLFVADRFDQSATLVPGGDSALPRSRVADADRRRDRLWLWHRNATDERGGAGGLEAVHLRVQRRAAEFRAFAESLPVGGNVASVADRDRDQFGRVAQRFANLVRGGLLPSDTMRVDRVHECHGVFARELSRGTEGIVKV